MSFIGPLTNNGTMTATGTVLAISKTVAGTGLLDIGGSATVSLANGSGTGTTADFLTADGLLDLAHPLNFAGTIGGFVLGDRIDLLNTAATGFSFSGGVLTVVNGATMVANLHLSGSYTNLSFALSSDAHGGTLITHT